MKPEEYKFSVEKEEYLPQENISVSFDGHTVERHIKLERAAQEFTFYVNDMDDNPVKGASIVLYPVSYTHLDVYKRQATT